MQRPRPRLAAAASIVADDDEDDGGAGAGSKGPRQEGELSLVQHDHRTDERLALRLEGTTPTPVDLFA